MISLPKPRHELGYTSIEICKFLKKHKISQRTFWKAYGINTCAMGGNGEVLYYPCDVERALARILRLRSVEFDSWD